MPRAGGGSSGAHWRSAREAEWRRAELCARGCGGSSGAEWDVAREALRARYSGNKTLSQWWTGGDGLRSGGRAGARANAASFPLPLRRQGLAR